MNTSSPSQILLQTWAAKLGIHNVENLRIHLPLGFSVKSILVILKVQAAILTILVAMNFEALESFDTFKCCIPKIWQLKTSKIIENSIF